MDPASRHYLRLFDLEKYQEIQPIIKGISERDTSIGIERVIRMIELARDVVVSNNFKKYNPDYIYEDYEEELDDILNLLKENSLQLWFDTLEQWEYGFNRVLQICVKSICCPKYQWVTDDCEPEQISGTTVDYTELYWRCAGNGLETLEFLNLHKSPIEILPFESDDYGITIGIFNKKQLKELDRILTEDIYSSSEFIGAHINIYRDINSLLELTNTRDNYTVLNEERS